MMLFFSCKKEDQVAKAEPIEKSVELKFERFDLEYAKANEKTLPALMAKYPMLFPVENNFEFWLKKAKDPIIKEINTEVQKKFVSLDSIENQVELLVSGVKKYFPEEKTPTLIALINEVNLDKKAYYTAEHIFISLDTYLGKNHKFYTDFPKYISENLEADQILPDLVTNFGYRMVLPAQNHTLLNEMIYFGKIHYLKDMLLVDTPDHQKIGYTKEKLAWCKANEEQMWSFFIGEKMLYDNNDQNLQKFIDEAPFSKFEREIDKDSPGRVGQWIGWQIVRAYMENNDVTLAELMKKDALEVFNNSKYKPKQ
jgi:gliding motility-associated lipoprotein GldB